MTEFRFRNSSHSSGDGECVEVACNLPDAVAVRDSKLAVGPVIGVRSRCLACLPDRAGPVGLIRSGRFRSPPEASR
ncbi:DUF397 domain-containing protein [Streptomyces pulveraceus]|uniref:DUF397 domain-containing protein n=1 Tax=Streptomyces pulveraceus TaxID=68258 RepID=UPI0031D8FAF9